MKKVIAISSSLAVSLAAILYLAYAVDLAALVEALQTLDPWLLTAGFFVLVLNYLLRTWRFRLLFDSRNIAWPRLLGIVQLYGTLNFLLPARTGELTFPLLVKRLAGTEYSVGTGSLVAARLLDMLSLMVLLPFALFFSVGELPTAVLRGSLLFVILMLVAATLGLVVLYRYPLNDPPVGLSATRTTTRLGKFLKQTARHLRSSMRPTALPGLIVLSSGVWLCIALNFHLMARATGADPPFFAAFAITLLMIPLSMLPLQGFANLGTHEVAWISVLAGLGLGMDTANRIALLTHLVLVLYVMLLGIMGLALVSSLKSGGKPPKGYHCA